MTSPTDNSTPTLPQLAGYQVVRPLGRSGRSFLAKQSNLGRLVVIKATGLPEQEPDRHELRAQTQALAKLNHASLTRILDVRESDGKQLVSMEYVEGFELDRLVRELGWFPVDLACECIRQAARGLQQLHEHNLVHGQVRSPKLVLSTSSFKSSSQEAVPPLSFWSSQPILVKVLNAGFDKRGSTDWAATPQCVAPELLEAGREVDARADLYSLGCVLYFLLCARHPFEAASPADTLDKHRWVPPRMVKLLRPEVPTKLSELIRRLMSKSPQERLQSAAELDEALKPFAEQDPSVDSGILIPGVSISAPAKPQAIVPAATPAPTPTATSEPSISERVSRFKKLRKSDHDFSKRNGDTWTTVITPPPFKASPTKGDPGSSSEMPAARAEAANEVQESDSKEFSASDLLAKRRNTLSGEMSGAVRLTTSAPAPRVEDISSKEMPAAVRADVENLQVQLAEQIERNEHVAARQTVGRLLELQPKDEVALEAREFLKSTIGEMGRFKKHTDWVTSVAFAANGKFFVSGSKDKTVRIWDVETGKEQHCLAHDSPVYSAAVTPDNQQLLSGDAQGYIHLWDIQTGKETRRFRGYDGEVISLAVAPNGQFFAAGTRRGTALIWEIGTGRSIRNLRGHAGEVSSVSCSIGSRSLLTCSADGTYRYWTGENFCDRQIVPLEKPARSVSFGSENHACLGMIDGPVIIHSLRDFQEVRRFSGHAGPVNSLAVSGDNRRLFSGGADRTVRFWRVRSAEQLSEFNGHSDEILAVSLSPDRRLGISGGKDQTVFLWKLPEEGEVID